MKKSLPLAALVCAPSCAVMLGVGGMAAVSTSANAAPIPAELVSVSYGTNSGASSFNLSASTATWTFDSVTGEAAMTGGTFYGEVLSPNTFGHTMTGVTLGNFVPTLGTWSCQEGVFGSAVGASLCGNYNFGSNKKNQSSYTPTPQGATVARSGDDGIIGAPQSLQTSYSNMTVRAVYSYEAANGGGIMRNFVFSNGDAALLGGYTFCFSTTTAAAGPFPPTNADCSIGPVVPVPPAVWLFGSALGVMGVLRRKISG